MPNKTYSESCMHIYIYFIKLSIFTIVVAQLLEKQTAPWIVQAWPPEISLSQQFHEVCSLHSYLWSLSKPWFTKFETLQVVDSEFMDAIGKYMFTVKKNHYYVSLLVVDLQCSTQKSRKISTMRNVTSNHCRSCKLVIKNQFSCTHQVCL